MPLASVALTSHVSRPPPLGSCTPFAGDLNDTTGGVLVAGGGVTVPMRPLMVTAIWVSAVWLAESVTTAFSVCAPLVYFLLSMLQVYDELVSVPTSLPSMKNCTCFTPLSSLALTVHVVTLLMVALFAGAVKLTVGLASVVGVLVPFLIVTERFAVAVRFALSYATARSV